MPQVAETTPEFFDDILGPLTPPAPAPIVGNGSSHAAIDRCRRYVEKMPPAIEGEKGSDKMLAVCCEIARFGLDDSAARVVADEFNQRCQPQWSEREIVHKLADARRKVEAQGEFGSRVQFQYERPHHAASRAAGQVTLQNDEKPVSYQWITARELAVATYTLEYDIEDLHVVGQPQITAAEKKALKTNTAIDASISQASGLPFLGKFPINRKTRVAVMSGESGLATIQETALRICKSKGIELGDLEDEWTLSADVPQLDDPRHHVALRKALAEMGIETLYIDPTYLCIPGDDAGNLIKQGRLLRIVGSICQELGVSLTMLHHCKKTVDDPFRPAELADISWSGFAEWARQWWLLSRRVRYDADRPGHHELWFNVGGSAGHSSLWALNIDEGSPSDPGGRQWQVEVLSAKDARQEAADQKEQSKKDARQIKHAAKVDAAEAAIRDALRSVPGNQDTERNIKLRAGMDGDAFKEARARMLRSGKLQEVEIQRDNKRKYPGFRYVFDDSK
jgi:hypothetical protein